VPVTDQGRCQPQGQVQGQALVEGGRAGCRTWRRGGRRLDGFGYFCRNCLALERFTGL